MSKEDFDELNKEDFDDLDNIIELFDEDGNTVRFEFLDLIEYEQEEYVILLPEEQDTDDEDGAEVVILRVDDVDGDEETYNSVDDDATLNAVFRLFKQKFKDVFNFTDDD